MADSILINNELHKTDDFKKNDELVQILSELNSLLKPIQLQLQEKFEQLNWPVGLIVGNARSGTTLFLQWMAKLGIFSYPSNVLNRFAYAPYIGAQIQKMLFDSTYDFSGEFSDINSEINFNSNIGKSKGALATSEFQHFFRNYMPNFDPKHLDPEELSKVDFVGIKKGLASIQAAFNKPFITKGFMLQYNIEALHNGIDNIIYIYIKRNVMQNMQSIYLARKKYYDANTIWLGPRPKEYSFLKDMDIYHQIAGQVYYTNQTIEKDIDKIPSKNKLKVDYEAFCKNPKLTYEQIVQKYTENGFTINAPYNSVESFEGSNKIHLTESEVELFNKAYNFFEKEPMSTK